MTLWPAFSFGTAAGNISMLISLLYSVFFDPIMPARLTPEPIDASSAIVLFILLSANAVVAFRAFALEPSA